MPKFSARFSIFILAKGCIKLQGIPFLLFASMVRKGECICLDHLCRSRARLVTTSHCGTKFFLVSGSLAPLIRAAAEFNPSLVKFEICAPPNLNYRRGNLLGHTSKLYVWSGKSRAAARVAVCMKLICRALRRCEFQCVLLDSCGGVGLLIAAVKSLTRLVHLAEMMGGRVQAGI